MFVFERLSAAIQVASLPASQAWLGADWEAAKAAKPGPAESSQDAGRGRSCTPDLASVVPNHSRAGAEDKGTSTPERKGSVAREAGGGLRRREGGLTLKERLQQCESTEDDRITFGKVGRRVGRGCAL